jgi:hypothetical protein
MNEELETEKAEMILVDAYDSANIYAEDDDLDASVVALLVRAIELATGRTVNMETMYDIYDF